MPSATKNNWAFSEKLFIPCLALGNYKMNLEHLVGKASDFSKKWRDIERTEKPA